MKGKKFLFITWGPGETSQARGFARYVHHHGGQITFTISQKINLDFLKDDKNDFDIQYAQNVEELYALLALKKPDILVICNSKIWGSKSMIHIQPPNPRPLTLCIDSNWLFNPEQLPKFRFVAWADKYLINIPKKIFELGLVQHGGHFQLSEKIRSKIEPVGFIPFHHPLTTEERQAIRHRYKISKEEKLIFAYASGFGAGHHGWILETLRNAVLKLRSKHHPIKVINVIPQQCITPQLQSEPDWRLFTALSAQEYYQLVAASDLVFQHQGLATLAQAISAQIPTIANVEIDPFTPTLPLIHFWEVDPFARAGVCRLHSNETSLQQVVESIETLLFNKTICRAMKKIQRQHHENGEMKAYAIAQELLGH